MTWMDNIIKWFKTPKTQKGIAGMIVIVIVLALDFAYWAGAIEVTGMTSGSEGGEEGEGAASNFTLELESEEFSDSLIAPSPLGLASIEGLQYNNHDFEVKENGYEAYVNATVSGGSPSARPDLELIVYDADGHVVSEQRTEAANEVAKIEEHELNVTGTWTARVENYSSFNIGYTLTIDIFYKIPKETTEEE
ncbi:MAG: hypothetical protein JSW00_08410 [Thermoplasmata archaeon]|nr:MAG: hypothetical protein JSW00_08410 [Thermoplasmata archaeon]